MFIKICLSIIYTPKEFNKKYNMEDKSNYYVRILYDKEDSQ